MGTEKYTQRQMIEAIRRSRGLVGPAAKRLGCAPATVRRYPAVAEALEDERNKLQRLALELMAERRSFPPFAPKKRTSARARARADSQANDHPMPGETPHANGGTPCKSGHLM